MADHSLIEWTDATWNPVTGCSVVSPGCTNCYAMKMAGTRLRHHPSRAGLTVASKAGPVWSGLIRFNTEWLTQPLQWKRPRRIFVAAHGDLFHEGVTDDHRDQVFAVMALCPEHTFQVLTKRPDRMRDYFTDADKRWTRIENAIDLLSIDNKLFNRDRFWTGAGDLKGRRRGDRHPLPNVWLGVSVEDQARADERIPALLQTPAAVRWISAEPLLGPVTFRWAKWHDYEGQITERRRAGVSRLADHLDGLLGLDWVVAGGESGPGARPMHPAWARQLRDQCAAAGVPFLFKQWGDHLPADWDDTDEGWCYTVEPGCDAREGDDYGDFGHQVPIDAHGTTFIRPGKKAAGRLLDGRVHDAFPEARR